MARTPVLLTLATLIIIPAASSLSLNVDVASHANHSVRDVQFKQEIQDFQEFNVSVENIGSIACEYRLKADFSTGNRSVERYSNAVGLWQGEYAKLNIGYVPLNYTGPIETDLSLNYCGLTRNVGEYRFNVTQEIIANDSIKSRTIRALEDQALIQINQGKKLVPIEEPSYWRTGPAEITNKTAELEYKSTIFDKTETIKYAVIEDRKVIGSTKVELDSNPTLVQRINDRKLQIISVLLIISVLINILLVIKILRPEKLSVKR